MIDEKCSMISTFYSQEGVVVSTDIENNRDNENIKQISKTYIWWSSSVLYIDIWSNNVQIEEMIS